MLKIGYFDLGIETFKSDAGSGILNIWNRTASANFAACNGPRQVSLQS